MLTPHPGEASSLIGSTTEAVQADRFAAARAIADKFGGVCVLKGAGTVVCSAGDVTFDVCDAGNPGMATAGMGDGADRRDRRAAGAGFGAARRRAAGRVAARTRWR